MKVLLFGATGMVGKSVLLECLDDSSVESVLVVGRSSCGVKHAKVEEALHDNFLDLSSLQSRFSDRDACFYCVGVSSVGMSSDKYFQLTFTVSVAVAGSVSNANPAMVFCFVSAQGADSSETGRAAWANVKGKTENSIGRLPFRSLYVFRPGLIQPMKGVTSRTRSYRIIYGIIGPVIPLLMQLFPGHVTTSVNVGRAIIAVARSGYDNRILENADINKVAALPRS